MKMKRCNCVRIVVSIDGSALTYTFIGPPFAVAMLFLYVQVSHRRDEDPRSKQRNGANSAKGQ